MTAARAAGLLAAAVAGGCAQAECAVDADCGGGRVCTVHGACADDPRPVVAWRAPEPGAAVADPFDVAVDVTFTGPEVEVVLQRDPRDPGAPCAPFLPATIVAPGDATGRTTAAVVFTDVAATGGGYVVEARTSAGLYATTRSFAADVDGATGVAIAAPTAGLVDADAAVAVPLQVDLDGAYDAVTAWVEPAGAPPSPRVVVAVASDVVDAHVPLARGAQIVRVEATRGDAVDRCAVALQAAPAARPAGVEIGLMFTGPAESAADLWLFDADGAPCRAGGGAGFCAAGFRSPRPAAVGGEILTLPAGDGLWGVAVVPGAAGPPLTAQLRTSQGDAHAAFVGPRTLDPGQGEVWLAARIAVVDGALSVEELFDVRAGLPSAPPGAW